MNRATTSRFRNIMGIAMLLAALVSLPLTGSAAGQLANVSAGSSSLEFSPLVEYGSMVLTVSGGGQVLRREFDAGERVSFDLMDDQGYALADDNYTWELSLAPSLDTLRSRLAEAREYGEVAAPGERLIQSGYFTIQGGALLSEAEEERGSDGGTTSLSAPVMSVSAADQVFFDDVIVVGSICVGQDCVNGESFGFDTLRLKENNLRIKFTDTSNSASFPTNDWQITANDSSNGGANKFSVDDIDGGRTPFTIEASAPSHSLYVDDGGRLGFGTSTPVADLHVKTGNTPTLRLEQDGSSGFTAQIWDVAGNEANYFIRDATNGSTLPFRIRPGAPSSAIDIAASGNVGLGTASPTEPLHVFRGGPARLKLTNNSVTNSATDDKDWILNSNGTLRVSAGTDAPELTLNAAGDMEITGGLVTGTAGTCETPTPCDGVFDPDFEVESIADHAEYMWANRHLPAVGPTPAGEPINLTRKTTTILNELEKAHIYIEQLNQRLEERDAQLSAVLERLGKLEQAASE